MGIYTVEGGRAEGGEAGYKDHSDCWIDLFRLQSKLFVNNRRAERERERESETIAAIASSSAQVRLGIVTSLSLFHSFFLTHVPSFYVHIESKIWLL